MARCLELSILGLCKLRRLLSNSLLLLFRTYNLQGPSSFLPSSHFFLRRRPQRRRSFPHRRPATTARKLLVTMQRPTCSNIRIRSTRDAHIIFHAVSLNILPIITRRLDADERAALRSGCVYAWEERGPHTEVTGLGIERFTEGRRWGPSRVRDVSLLVHSTQ